MKTRIVAPFLLIALVLTGCSQAGEVIDQARDLQETVDDLQESVENIRWCSDVARLAAAVETANVEAARNLVDALERTAPEDLAADVDVVRVAVQEIEAGNAQAADLPSEDVNAAVARLLEAAEQRCADVVDSEFGDG